MSLLLPLMMMQQMLLPKKKPKLSYGAETTLEFGRGAQGADEA